MEKSFRYCLSLFLTLCFQSYTFAQTDICANKAIRDSLITRYLDKGAHRYGYTHPKWEIYCDSLISICPGIAEAYREKAIPYIKYGDFEKAMTLKDKAVELDPDKWIDYRAFLKCIFTKDYEGALADFKLAKQYHPEASVMDHFYPFYEGLCYLEMGQYKDAEKNLKQDIGLQKKYKSKGIHFNTLFYMGVVHYEMKNYNSAKKYLIECLKSYNQFPDANFYLSLIYLHEKKPSLALKHLELAKNAFENGYMFIEDNVYYCNYPHQISMYEVEQAINSVHK